MFEPLRERIDATVEKVKGMLVGALLPVEMAITIIVVCLG